MTHTSGHYGTDPDNPDDWTDEAWAEEQKRRNAGSGVIPVTGNLPEGATYSQYLTIRRNYANLTPEEQVKFERLKNYYTLVYGRSFLPEDTFTVIKDGKPTTISSGEGAEIIAYIMSERVLTGAIADPMEATLQDEVETEEKPNTLRIRIMQQKSEDGISWTEPVDVNVQLTEAQYDFLSASPAWDGLADVDEKTRIITTHTNNWWDLRVIMQDITAMGLEGTFDPGDESDPNFDPAAAGGDAEGMLAAIFAKANGAVSAYNPYNPRNDGLPLIPAEFAKTGITWSIDPISGTRELVDTKPWVGPPAGALRWVPNDPTNDPMGAGNWRVDPEEQLNLQATMWEGVPGAVRPWLQAVLDAGGDLNILNQALPQSVRDAIMSDDPAGMMGQLEEKDRATMKQHDILRSWVGFILGQARASSDPEFGSPILKDEFENWIPLGSGEVPAKEFDLLLPNFLSSLTPGESKKQPAAATAKGPGKSQPPAKTTSGSGEGAGSTGGASAGAGSSGNGGGNGGNGGNGGDNGKDEDPTGPTGPTDPTDPNNPDTASLPIDTTTTPGGQIFPGSQLPPELTGPSAGKGYSSIYTIPEQDPAKKQAPEIGGDGILGDIPDYGDGKGIDPEAEAKRAASQNKYNEYVDKQFEDYSQAGDAGVDYGKGFEDWKKGYDAAGGDYGAGYRSSKVAEAAKAKAGDKTATGIWSDDQLGSGELGGDTGGGFWGTGGTSSGSVAAANAAAKARAAAAAAAQKAKDDEELARIAAMGG